MLYIATAIRTQISTNKGNEYIMKHHGLFSDRLTAWKHAIKAELE